MSWGTDYNWIKVANHYLGDDEFTEKTVRTKLVEFLANTIACGNLADGRQVRKLMEQEGIWPQGLQIAIELDLKIIV